MSAAQQLLDQVHSVAGLAALEAEPSAYAGRLADELGDAGTRDALAARDDRLRDALARIDAMIERATRIRLDHLLADDSSIAIPTRKVFASTVASYEGRLDLLEARAREVARRGGSPDPARTAARVVEAAGATLATGAAVRAGVLALIAALAKASTPHADLGARDRRNDEASRRAWSAIRRELETLAAQPERVAGAPIAARLATWPDQLDEPDQAAEPTLAELIELD